MPNNGELQQNQHQNNHQVIAQNVENQEAQNQQLRQNQQLQMNPEYIRNALYDGKLWDSDDLWSEKGTYYNRILENNLDRNLALKAQAADRPWEAEAVKDPIPVQKLPTAKMDGKYKSAEKTALKKLRETNSEADLNTLRESYDVSRYFESGGHMKVEAVGNENDPKLAEYVAMIISVPFDRNLFTDDYLSTHITELYELTCQMEDFPELKEKYPAFFDALPVDQRAQLEERATYAVQMRELLEIHMELHGLEFVPGTKPGSRTVRVHDDTKDSSSVKRNRKRVLKAQYDRAYNTFFKEKIDKFEVNYARNFTSRMPESSQVIEESLAGRIAEKNGVNSYYGYGISVAFKEYRRVLAIRDDFVANQRMLLGEYDDPNVPAEDKQRCAKRIAGNNSRIALMNKQVSAYESVLCFLGGITDDVPEDVEAFLKSESHGDILEFVGAKIMIDGIALEQENPMEEQLAHKAVIDELKTHIYKDTEKASATGTFSTFYTYQAGRNQIKEIVRPLTDVYMKLTDEQRDVLRKKKKYIHERKLNGAERKYSPIGVIEGNGIGPVGEALRELLPDAYKTVDKIQREADKEKREVDLIHAMGTEYLAQGHDVIEFDIGGSSFRELSKNHNGFYGYGEQDEATMQKMYGKKYNEEHPGAPEYIREKVKSGEGEFKDRKKYRYTIAGPSPDNGGGVNAGDYSIKSTTSRIRDLAVAKLLPIFQAWDAKKAEKDNDPKQPGPDLHTIDIMVRGHSRGGVGAVMGAMKLKYWLHNFYPQYEPYVKFQLIQMDPVPGKGSNYGGYDVVDHLKRGDHEVSWYGRDLMPLGESAETTVVYSMHTQYAYAFTPQEVRGVKRMILTPFNHGVGLTPHNVDTTQMTEAGEKVHAIPYIDGATGKVYRQSGLNQLPEGVYIMDEHNVLIRIEKLMDFIKVMQKTVPKSLFGDQSDRHMVLLQAVATKLGVSHEDARAMWDANLKKTAPVQKEDVSGDMEVALAEIDKESHAKDAKVSIEECELVDDKYVLNSFHQAGTSEHNDYIFSSKPENVTKEMRMHLAGNRLMKFCGLGEQIMRVEPVYAAEDDGTRYYGVKIGSAYDFANDRTPADIRRECTERKSNNLAPLRVEYSADAIRQMSAIRLMVSLLGDTKFNPLEDLRMVTTRVEQSDGDTLIINGVFIQKLNTAFDTEVKGKDLAIDKAELKRLDIPGMPAIDKATVDMILGLTPEKLRILTCDLLTEKQLTSMFSRLEQIQKDLRGEVEADEKRSKKDKRIIAKEDWEKPAMRQKLQRAFRDNPDSIFVGLFGETQVNIEYCHDKEAQDDVRTRDGGEFYEKVYQGLKARIKGAATATEAITLMGQFSVALRSDCFGATYSLEKVMADEAIGRIFGEMMTEPMMEAYVVERAESIKRLHDKFNQAMQSNAVVPPEFRDEKAIEKAINVEVEHMRDEAEKEENGGAFDEQAARTQATLDVENRLRREYAVYTITMADPKLILDIDILDQVAVNSSDSAFLNRTMNMNFVDGPLNVLKSKTDAYRKNYPDGTEEYDRFMNEGTKAHGVFGHFTLLKADKIREVTDSYTAYMKNMGSNLVRTIGAGPDPS